MDWRTAPPTRSTTLTGRSAKLLWAVTVQPNPLMWLFPPVRHG